MIGRKKYGGEDQRKNKSEQKHIRDDDEWLKGFETCEVLVFSVLTFGIDNINSLKLKEVRVFL